MTLLYAQDLAKGKIFKVFVLLSVIISCIGLLGLTIYTLDKRTKEISIRKVLGASLQNITILLSGSFLKLILISNVIAFPLAYWLSQQWLSEFSYRIVLGMDIIDFQVDASESLELPLMMSGKGVVIQQYTGLKDKNDREIYEGDIVSRFEDRERCLVSFNNDNYGEIFGWNLLDLESKNDDGSFQAHAHYYGSTPCGIHGWEVVGNMFENPELLER